MRATPNKVYVVAVVAQLVEPRVVISVVVGSSPISRPNIFSVLSHLTFLSHTTFIVNMTLASFGNFLRRTLLPVCCFLNSVILY